MPAKKEDPKLETIVVIGKFDDGKCRQVLINDGTQDAVLSCIALCEGSIRVHEKIIDGIDITEP